MKEIHIFDLDGTLINSAHRYRTLHNGKKKTIDLEHWRDNEKHFARDTLLPLADTYKRLNADPDIYTLWCTARTEKHMTQSRGWLNDKLGNPNKIFCRPDGCYTSGALLKAKQLKSFLSLRQFKNAPRFFYDDNRAYLLTVAIAIHATTIFIESKQGY